MIIGKSNKLVMKKNIIFLVTAIVILFNGVAIAQNKIVKPTSSALSTSELLQGKWQSLDDKTNFLVFDKNN